MTKSEFIKKWGKQPCECGCGDLIASRELIEKDLDELLRGIHNVWHNYDFNKLETRPTSYGKYFVARKDGKVHWEVWNGNGFAYNNNVITHWMEVKKL